MVQLSEALQNIKSTLYNLRNVSKYNILQSSLQEILKLNHYFTKIRNSNIHVCNKTFKHYST